MEKEKIKALADFLQISIKEARELIESGSYEVLNDEEAEEKAAEYIKGSLWAFNADFILKHCKNADSMDCYEWDAAKESIEHAQAVQCESLNGLCFALIDNINEFIQDAIQEDGRGHFISFYDGKEHEQNGFFIYKQN